MPSKPVRTTDRTPKLFQASNNLPKPHVKVGRSTAFASVLAAIAIAVACAGPAAGASFNFTEPMNDARFSHTATLLPNGKVLVTGGQQSGSSLKRAELYDPVAVTWQPTSPMNVSRDQGQTATLLPNGKVLVVGGLNSCGTAEVYNPADGLWTSTPAMNYCHNEHTATLLPNGKVLVAGGGNQAASANAELYDPVAGTAGTWTAINPMNAARAQHSATLLGNGKVLVVGGGNAICELYDPQTGTWANKASINAFPNHSATLLPNGKVLVAGGSYCCNPSGAPVVNGNAQVFDPILESWSSANSMNVARGYHTATLLPNGKVLVAGGSVWLLDPLNDAEVFDPGTLQWTPTTSMGSSRAWSTATLLPNGQVLMVGGFDDSGILGVASAELYTPTADPAAGTWALGTSLMNAARSDHTATTLPNGKILVVGGTGDANAPTTATLYDPATTTWISTASPLYSRNRHTATLLPNGTVLVAGGLGNITATEIYDPASATWTPTPGSLNQYRSYHTATLLPNGRVLLAGGSGPGGYLASAEVYDPVTGLWTLTANSMTQSRSTHTATLLGNGKVLVAGGYGSGTPSVRSSADLFDWKTGTWTAISGSMTDGRRQHTATLLGNGKVLVTGGQGVSAAYLSSAEVYNPFVGSTGTWEPTASFTGARRQHTATLLPANGKVLICGGLNGGATAQLYDPNCGTWISALSMTAARYAQTATLLPSNGRLLVAGGIFNVASAEVYAPQLYNNTAPVAAFQSPADGAFFVSAPIAIAVTVNDSDPGDCVLRVEFWDNNTKVADMASAGGGSYTYNWMNIPVGSHTIFVKAFDAHGGMTVSASRTIRLNQAPTVTLTNPEDGNLFPPNFGVSVLGFASDPDPGDGIQRVEVWVDSAVVGNMQSSGGGYQFNLVNLPVGNHVVQLRAYDTHGAFSLSQQVTFLVDTLPAVVVDLPVAGAQSALPNTVTAHATDPDPGDSFSRAELWADGCKVADMVQRFFGYFDSPWLPNPPYGTHVITVRVYDSFNRFADSPPRTITIGTKGYWKLDEGSGATALDSSGGGNTMTLHNTTWTAGRVGPYALNSGGGFGSVNNANGALLSEGDPFTVSFWFNPDSLPAGLKLLAANEGAGSLGWKIGVNTPAPATTQLRFWSSESGGNLGLTAPAVLLPGLWHKLTVTHSGAAFGNEGRLYLDGQLLGTAIGTVHGGPSTLLLAGGIDEDVPALAGKYDDLRLYSRVLTAEEISLNGHWRLNEGSGSVAMDATDNGRNATLSGSGGWAAGRKSCGSSSLQLNLVQATIPNTDQAVVPPTGGSFTLSLWFFYSSVAQGNNGLLACQTANTGWQLALLRDANGANFIHFWSTVNGGTLDLMAPTVGLSPSQWNHIAVSFNGGIATAYLNGRPIGTGTGGIKGSIAPFQFGGLPGIPNLAGRIEDVKVYGCALPHEAIGPVAKVIWETVLLGRETNIMLQGFGPPGRPLTYAILEEGWPTKGNVTLSGSTCTYTAGTTKGPDTFSYTVSDGVFTTPPTTVHMSIVQPHWLSTATSGNGSGDSPDFPLYAQPAERLRDLWTQYNNYDCFFYLPGDFETLGYRFNGWGTTWPGCKHVGTVDQSGVPQSTLRLVGATGSTSEGFIFRSVNVDNTGFQDDFEVRDLVLDCNAQNNPKYALGEAITITIPLKTVSPIDRVELYWASGRVEPLNLSGENPVGNADILSVELFLDDGITRSDARFENVPGVQIIPTYGALANRVKITLNRRAPNVHIYGLREVKVISGANNLAPSGQATVLNSWSDTYGPKFLNDGNLQTFWASSTQGPVGAIDVAGSNLKFTNLKFINFGTKAGSELFVLHVAPNYNLLDSHPWGNVLVENCTFSNPAMNNSEGATIALVIGLNPFPLTNAVVRNCQVLNMRPYFIGLSQAFSAQELENCLAQNCDKGVYFELRYSDLAGRTGLEYQYSMVQCLIRSNVFVDCLEGMHVHALVNGHLGGIQFLNNDVTMSANAVGGVTMYAEVGGDVGNVVYLNNRIHFPDWQSHDLGPQFRPIGISLNQFLNSVIGNNVLLTDRTLSTDPPMAVVRSSELEYANTSRDNYPWRALFNNRLPDGTLLKVQHDTGTPNQFVFEFYDDQWP